MLVLETGVGAVRMEAALGWLLKQLLLGNMPYQPKVILSAGFAGALHDDYRVGDVMLATEVVDLEGHCWPVTWPRNPVSSRNRVSARPRGRILSVPRLVGNPEEKRALGHQYGTLAVDMESAAVARHCHQHRVPFACVRVISDDVDTPLSPHLLSLLSGSQISPMQVIASLLRSPLLAGEFWRMARQTRYAARQLGAALRELLTLRLAPGGEY